jgi:hypothetical protein
MMDSIMSNGTWEITIVQVVANQFSYKWIFKTKMRLDGTIEKYKARLVAKGYAQK